MTSLTEMPWMLLFAVPWQQISGAVAGGLEGGFSGFVANNIHARRETRRTRRNVASALIGEIGAIAHYIKTHYLAVPNQDAPQADQSELRRRHFRGERDY